MVWTDSWPSIACVGSDLICVGAGEEQARKVYACVASKVWRDKRLGSRDKVAMGSSAGRMVARRARRSQEWFLS
jgi:hypothetical protein